MPASNSKSPNARSQSKRAPGSVDRDIGRRMRERRDELGITLETVATGLGVTIHQVQKYETGINRIGAARLLDVSNILKCQPIWLLTGRTTNASGPEAEALEAARAQLAELIKIFMNGLDDNARVAVLEFARHLGDKRP